MPRVQRTVAPFFAAFLAALGTSGCSYLFPSCATIPDCPKGQKLCNNLNCSDVSTDPFNCGFCDNACSEGLACIPDAGPDGGPACGCAVAGQTKVGAHCYDFSVDSRNCGGFGKSCRPDQVCFDGGCGCPMPGYLASFLDGGDGECTGDAGP